MGKVQRRVVLAAISREKLYETLGFANGKLPEKNTETLVFEGVTLRDRRGEPLENIGAVTVRVRSRLSWGIATDDETNAEREQRERWERRERGRRVDIVCPNCRTPNDFGSFPQHFTTPRCDQWARIEAAKMPIPHDTYRFAEFEGGFILLRCEPEAIGVTLCDASGKELAYENWHFVNNERYSMLWNNAMAFGDWFAEQEDFPLKKPKLRELWKLAVVAYGVKGRAIDFNQFNALTQNVLSHWKHARAENPHETREQRLARMREERKERAETMQMNAAIVQRTLTELKG